MGRALALVFVSLLGVLGTAVALVAQRVEIPPDTVTTVFVSDSLEGYGAVGGVAADGLGYVYIADFRNTVWRLSPDGEVTKFGDGLYGASGNAVGPRGHLFQSNFNGNFIARITRTGHWERYAEEGLSGPVGIAVGAEGELFVVNCSGGTVSRVGTDRRVTLFSDSELLSCPNGITFDDRGDLYVVNFNSTKLVKITPDGTATEFTDIPGAGGNAHIAFARGAFYVTKMRGNQIYRVNRDGSFAVIAGTGQPGSMDGPALHGQFPDSALAQFHRGEAYRYTGQAQKAAEQYRRVLELQPDHPTAAARLAEVTGG